MNTTSSLKIATKVKATIELGFKKTVLAEKVGISRQKLDARLKDNSWQDAEINALRRLGII
jgi:DNA-binding Xre family transcriptional regulator